MVTHQQQKTLLLVAFWDIFTYSLVLSCLHSAWGYPGNIYTNEKDHIY